MFSVWTIHNKFRLYLIYRIQFWKFSSLLLYKVKGNTFYQGWVQERISGHNFFHVYINPLLKICILHSESSPIEPAARIVLHVSHHQWYQVNHNGIILQYYRVNLISKIWANDHDLKYHLTTKKPLNFYFNFFTCISFFLTDAFSN